jgi:N-acetylmuramoyl-L-alanine amidase
MRESLADTKVRLVREAIQDNLLRPRRVRPKTEVLPRVFLPVWMAGSFLIASLVYLGLPSKVDSRGWVASAATRRVTAVESPVPVPQRLHREVLPLAVRTIILDPGHGGAQTGAISDSGVSEKEITLDIALRLRRLLKDALFDVLMTRETDATLSLQQRVAFANTNRGDLFVSIHVNWIPRRQIRPLETYYVGPTDDPAASRLASAENRDSGYSLAAYRRLLEKIYIDTRRDESHALAQTINTELYRSLREANPALANRGVKTAPFVVLVGTEMPAILVEVSCLSNEADVGLLTKADHREKIAGALLRGIRAYANDLDGVGRKQG